jgi:hypothetical protein
MVDAVRPRHLAEPRDARERPDGEALVHEAVVHDDVREAEERHAGAGAERDLPDRARRGATPVEDERDRDRRVQRAQRVVRFEPAAPRAVVRPMNPPQPPMPHAAVQERGPEVHRDGDEDRGRNPERRARDHAHLEGGA